jgi:hypothetical protein
MKGKTAWIAKDKHTGYLQLFDRFPEIYEYDEEYEITKIVYFEVED